MLAGMEIPSSINPDCPRCRELLQLDRELQRRVEQLAAIIGGKGVGYGSDTFRKNCLQAFLANEHEHEQDYKVGSFASSTNSTIAAPTSIHVE